MTYKLTNDRNDIRAIWQLYQGHAPYSEHSTGAIVESWEKYVDSIIKLQWMSIWDSDKKEWIVLKMGQSIDSDLKIIAKPDNDTI